jgi:hypothetical protein
MYLLYAAYRIFSRGGGILSNEGHAFSVGEGFSQMGKKL